MIYNAVINIKPWNHKSCPQGRAIGCLFCVSLRKLIVLLRVHSICGVNNHLSFRRLVRNNFVESRPSLLPIKYLEFNYQGHVLFSYATQAQRSVVDYALCKRHLILLSPRDVTVTCICIHWLTVNSAGPEAWFTKYNSCFNLINLTFMLVNKDFVTWFLIG